MKLLQKATCLFLSLLLLSACFLTTATAYVSGGDPSVSTVESSTALAIGGAVTNAQPDSIYKIAGHGWTSTRGDSSSNEQGSITFKLPSAAVLAEQPYFQLELYIDLDAVPYTDSNAKHAFFDVDILNSEKTRLGGLKLGADNGGTFGMPTDASRTWTMLQLRWFLYS